MLNKRKPFLTCYGSNNGIAFEQDGKFFDGLGREVNPRGDLLEELEFEEPGPDIPEPEEPEKEEEEYKGLSHDKIKENRNTDLMLVERLKISAPNDPNFVKKSDIISELKKLKIKFDARAGRDDLCLILKEHYGIT